MRAFTVHDVASCPIRSMSASHYREDGTCLCGGGSVMVHTPSMEAEGTMPRPTPTSERREGALQVLMTPEERAAIDAAAQEDGVATGAWLRMLGLREAKKRREKR